MARNYWKWELLPATPFGDSLEQQLASEQGAPLGVQKVKGQWCYKGQGCSEQ